MSEESQVFRGDRQPEISKVDTSATPARAAVPAAKAASAARFNDEIVPAAPAAAKPAAAPAKPAAKPAAPANGVEELVMADLKGAVQVFMDADKRHRASALEEVEMRIKVVKAIIGI